MIGHSIDLIELNILIHLTDFVPICSFINNQIYNETIVNLYTNLQRLSAMFLH